MTGLVNVGDHRRIGEVGDAFEPIALDLIAPRRLSIMQFYVQEGDIMSDPMIDFFIADDGIYPLTFEMSNPPVYQEPAKIEGGKVVVINQKQYRDLALFCIEWCRNMDQQHQF